MAKLTYKLLFDSGYIVEWPGQRMYNFMAFIIDFFYSDVLLDVTQ